MIEESPKHENKTERINVRVSPSLKIRLKGVETLTRIPESAITTFLLEAFCDYAESSGRITLPVAVVTAPCQNAGTVTLPPA